MMTKSTKITKEQFLAQNILKFRGAQSEGVDTEGGYSVESVLDERLSHLLSGLGVAGRYSRQVAMPTHLCKVPKKVGNTSASVVAEGVSIPLSDLDSREMQMLQMSTSHLLQA
jgi:hypothetical protein